MKNIIILNLTRMGDLIQSTALLKKIKLIYPDSRITLALSGEFAEIAPFLPEVDEIKIIDLKGLSELLKSVNFEFNLDVFKAVNLMFEGISSFRYDLAINLSHDEFSVYFLYILNSLKNIGLSITREGTIISTDKMIAYMFSAVKNRKVSVLNLVDIYERCFPSRERFHVNKIFLDTEKPNMERDNGAGNIASESGIKEGDTVVSFAIGASTHLKKWRYDYFAELAKMLINSDSRMKVVLLGAGYDVEAGGYIEDVVNSEKLLNLTGKTSVSELVAMVKRSNLLITHDTGTMHIGVATGVKSIVIYTGNVGFLETGPYSEGNVLVVPDIGCFPCDFNLKCLNPVCKNLIKPEYIFDIAKMVMSGENTGNYYSMLSGYKNSGIIPFISRFDSKNFIDFLPVVKEKLSFTDLKLKILKMSLEHFYERDFWKIDADEIDIFFECFENIEYNLDIDITEELNVVGTLISLCEKGMEQTKRLVNLAMNNPFMINEINKISEHLKYIDFELKYHSSVYDDLSLFNQVHVINQNSSVSYDIFGLALDSLKSYSDYKHQLKIFKNVSIAFLKRVNAFDKIKNNSIKEG